MIGSSLSTIFIGSSSSSLLLVESESNILTLLTELDTPGRSVVWDHGLCEAFGELKPEEIVPFRRWGMDNPRPPTTGEVSGDDSASVERCKFVHALEKSRPLDRRGKTGEPYMLEGSSFGESGARLPTEPGPLPPKFDGNCSERFVGRSDLWGVSGGTTEMSSLLDCGKCGFGEAGRETSERDRAFNPERPSLIGFPGKGDPKLL